MLSKREMPTGF